MKFEPFQWLGFSGYAAVSGQWQFLILGGPGSWTAYYRLINPSRPVSASSTIMGPFASLGEAEASCRHKLAELRRLA